MRDDLGILVGLISLPIAAVGFIASFYWPFLGWIIASVGCVGGLCGAFIHSILLFMNSHGR